MLKKIFRLSLFLLLLALLSVYGFYKISLMPVNAKNDRAQIFVVPQGQPVKIIASRLKAEHLIRNELVFRLLVDRKSLTYQLQAGDFRLSPAMDLATIIDALTHGSLDYWITFPEGLRVEEYAEKLAEKSKINTTDFILAAKPFEGQLFPDTYLIPQSANAEDVTFLLTETFNNKSPTQDKKMIILASMVEREAKHSEDRKLVASVLINRLKIGMALQIDATVQYALGKAGRWWPKELTKTDLQVDSPYNTYSHSSLPPKPICNPGLESLKAVLSPAETNYLYYISDKEGNNHYASTLEGHNQNIAKYLTVDN